MKEYDLYIGDNLICTIYGKENFENFKSKVNIYFKIKPFKKIETWTGTTYKYYIAFKED